MNSIDIKHEHGKYIIDATIHSEILTNDLSEAQKQFSSDCAFQLNEAIKRAINISHITLLNRKAD